ncbi:MAG: tripartite tricarboxylate transporter substrate-binding protein [Casimicrobiaceae bacterium]
MAARPHAASRAGSARTAHIATAALVRAGALVLAGALFASVTASAQQTPWPVKTVRLISPFNPGGAIDVLNRLIAEKLAARIGQPVIVEAIPGANTIKGAEALARAAPDGHTFMITTMSTTVNNVALYPKLPYDVAKDFAGVTQLSLGSVLLVASADAPFDDVKGFIAWAKAQNRPITFGSWGIGSSAHLYGEVLRRDHGVNLSHVPYKGELPAIVDVINKSLDVTFASPVGAKPQIAAGKIKPIGMTGPRRSVAMPELATFAEQGTSGMDLAVWVGVYAPAGTPKQVIDRLQQELAAIVKLPDIAQKMADQGQTPIVNSPEEFARAYQADFPKWEALIKASGAKAE